MKEKNERGQINNACWFCYDYDAYMKRNEQKKQKNLKKNVTYVPTLLPRGVKCLES